MDIQQTRALMRTQSIYDIPLRVTFYARVSSDTDEQLNSLDNQVAYYEDFIRKVTAWTYLPGYVDEGISGISTKKRAHFNEMIADAREGLFDLVITKEISRFARNTLDSLQYTRELLRLGVGVFFQNDNINTLDEDAELRLTIMSSIAQDELRKLSSRVKFGHQQAIKSKVVLGNSRIFGYRKDDKRLVIDEEQAPMVRELYRRYATDEYSLKQLEDIFYAMGYRNYNGKKIAHTTLSGIISNPKYKGYYVGNKVKVVDMFTKKQKFLPPEEWVMFKDETGEIVPAIISEELWDKANDILRRRSEDVRNRQGICNHANLLTGKLWCSHCGKPYYRRESKSKDGNINSRWVCSGKINNGKTSCPSFSIYEDEIKKRFIEVCNQIATDKEDFLISCQQIVEMLSNTAALDRKIEAQYIYLNGLAVSMQEFIKENAMKPQDEDFYKKKMAEYNSQKAEAEKVLHDLQDKRAARLSRKELLEGLIRTMNREGIVTDTFDGKLWLLLVEKATLGTYGKLTFTLRNGTEIEA